MALLNLNKKAGDTFTAEEVNKIGKAIDDNTTSLKQVNNLLLNGYVFCGIAELGTVPQNINSIFYLASREGIYKNFGPLEVGRGLSLLIRDSKGIWSVQTIQTDLYQAVDDLMMGNQDHVAAAWVNESNSEVAVKKIGSVGLVDWKMFLIDMTDNANEFSTPVGVLQRNNLLRFEDGTFAPVVGITKEMKAACDVELYRMVNGQLTKYCNAGQFDPVKFYNEYGMNEKLFNISGSPVRVLRPWETSETKYSVFLGYENNLYLIHNVIGNSGKLWNAVFTERHSWDGISPIELLPTGITPSGVYCIEENGVIKTRCFFNDYNGLNKGSVHSSGSTGNGGCCAMFSNNGTYPTTAGIQQINNMQWARNNNASQASSLPFAEGGFPYRDLFVSYLEIVYGRKDLHNENFFGSGISSNETPSNESGWLSFGGVRYKVAGAGAWKYAGFNSTPSDVYYNASGKNCNWSDLLNGYYAKEKCMESQMAASFAVEMNVPEGTHFNMYGGEYWWKRVPGALGLLDGRMNVKIYKIMRSEFQAFSKTGEKVTVNVEVILRMSLFEGAKLSGDIFQYFGGGYEVVGETLPTSVGGSVGEPVDIYLQPDQKLWHRETATTKQKKGKFDFEQSYFKLGESKTQEGYALRSVPFSNFPIKIGGGLTKGECYYIWNSNWWGYSTPGDRVRIAQRFCGYATRGNCSPRFAHCNYAVSFPYASSGGSAQVRLKRSVIKNPQG